MEKKMASTEEVQRTMWILLNKMERKMERKMEKARQRKMHLESVGSKVEPEDVEI